MYQNVRQRAAGRQQRFSRFAVHGLPGRAGHQVIGAGVVKAGRRQRIRHRPIVPQINLSTRFLDLLPYFSAGPSVGISNSPPGHGLNWAVHNSRPRNTVNVDRSKTPLVSPAPRHQEGCHQTCTDKCRQPTTWPGSLASPCTNHSPSHDDGNEHQLRRSQQDSQAQHAAAQDERPPIVMLKGFRRQTDRDELQQRDERFRQQPVRIEIPCRETDHDSVSDQPGPRDPVNRALTSRSAGPSSSPQRAATQWRARVPKFRQGTDTPPGTTDNPASARPVRIASTTSRHCPRRLPASSTHPRQTRVATVPARSGRRVSPDR